MKDDIRKLEKVILNMRPNGVIQTQIVDALTAILCIAKKLENPIVVINPGDQILKMKESIKEIKVEKPVAPTMSGDTSNAKYI